MQYTQYTQYTQCSTSSSPQEDTGHHSARGAYRAEPGSLDVLVDCVIPEIVLCQERDLQHKAPATWPGDAGQQGEPVTYSPSSAQYF